MSIAKATILGHLGRDPETRYSSAGKMSVAFSIATNRKWTDGGGNLQENTTWFRVTAWGRLAETLDNLTQQGALAKGREVLVIGDLEQREWTGQDGAVKQSLEVNASDVQLLGAREQRTATDAPMTDVPF
jgi:single-strand DNA-binding protein